MRHTATPPKVNSVWSVERKRENTFRSLARRTRCAWREAPLAALTGWMDSGSLVAEASEGPWTRNGPATQKPRPLCVSRRSDCLQHPYSHSHTHMHGKTGSETVNLVTGRPSISPYKCNTLALPVPVCPFAGANVWTHLVSLWLHFWRGEWGERERVKETNWSMDRSCSHTRHLTFWPLPWWTGPLHEWSRWFIDQVISLGLFSPLSSPFTHTAPLYLSQECASVSWIKVTVQANYTWKSMKRERTGQTNTHSEGE